MEKKLDEKEIQEAINEANEKMKKEKEILNAERKAALTWNIIFFIGILITTIVISIITTLDSLNFKDFFQKLTTDRLGIWSVILGIISSFLVGIFGSYFKTKSLKAKSNFEIQEFIKEAYLNRLEKSKLNPNRQL